MGQREVVVVVAAAAAVLVGMGAPGSCSATLDVSSPPTPPPVIFSLNESEYYSMPALFALEEWEACVSQPGALYCVLDAELVAPPPRAPPPPPLYTTIQGYSAYSLKHYNHSQVHRGMCVPALRAPAHLPRYAARVRDWLQRTLNASLWDRYELQANIINIRYCTDAAGVVRRDVGEGQLYGAHAAEGEGLLWADLAVGVLCAALLLLNALGTAYHLLCRPKNGNAVLMAFSVARNWQRLVHAPPHPDPRLRRFKAIHGLRVLTMFAVLFSHVVLLISFAYVANPLYVEKAYDDAGKYVLFNGNLVTYTFLVISAFLLVYNYLVLAETRPPALAHLPRGLLLRYLRLTPAYALVLGVTATWGARAGTGPLWPLVVGSEAVACRRYFLYHILYINNYIFDDALCAPQSWYLAADTQLFWWGLSVMVCTGVWSGGHGHGQQRGQQRAWLRRAGLVVLAGLVLGVLLTAAHTAAQDLDAIVLQTPEKYRTLYAKDLTFRTVYIAGHTNLAPYCVGMLAALAYYRAHLPAAPAHPAACACACACASHRRRWAWACAYWAAFPVGVAMILSGAVWYRDALWDAPPSLLARALYAATHKVLFTALLALILLGSFAKLDGVYRGVLEWPAWRWMSRVSYGAYLLHAQLQRAYVATARHPLHMTEYNIIMLLCGSVVVTWAGAVLLHLLLDAPLAALTRPPAPAAPPPPPAAAAPSSPPPPPPAQS